MGSPPSTPPRVRGWLDAALARSPAQPLFLWRAARHLTVLAYHEISDGERFADHLDHLLALRRPISLEQLHRALDGGGLPRGAVLVTFDDGDPSVLEAAAPLLAERGIPGVVFVVTDLLDTESPPWWREAEELWGCSGRRAETGALHGIVQGEAIGCPAELVARLKDLPDAVRRTVLAQLRASASKPVTARRQLRRRELRELESQGVAVGSHTAGHPCLSRCDDSTLRREILTAHEVLEDALGHVPSSFAFPNGDTDPRAHSLLRELSYRSAFLFDHRLASWPPRDPLLISRIRVSSRASRDRFRILLSGLHSALHHCLGREEKDR